MIEHRIKWLDSFRFAAVSAVLLYHLTNPLTAHYQHADFFLHTAQYGYLGVNLFFMISGFVISLTLEQTPDFLSFHINRFCRLFPAMLLCSLLTFTLVNLIDIHQNFPQAHQAKNLLPGFLFINPQIWTLISGHSFHWINGSYWTLWTEIQFYFLASVIYFLDKDHFFRNFLWVAVLLSLLKYVPQYGLNYHPDLLAHYGLKFFFKGWVFTNEVFNLDFFITWFLLGVLFYRFYKVSTKRNSLFWFGLTVALCCLVRDSFHFFEGVAVSMSCAAILFCGLFFLMILRKDDYSFPFQNIAREIGVSSYSIYLVHEVIGLLLINSYSVYLGGWSFLTPFMIIALVLIFAALSFRFYERPAQAFLKRLLIDRTQ